MLIWYNKYAEMNKHSFLELVNVSIPFRYGTTTVNHFHADGGVSIPFRYGTTQIFSIVTNILFYFFHKFNLFPYKKSVDLIFRQTDVDLYNLTFPRLFVFLRNLVPRSTDFLSSYSVKPKLFQIYCFY